MYHRPCRYNEAVRAARQQILGALVIALLILALLLVRFGRLLHWSAR